MPTASSTTIAPDERLVALVEGNAWVFRHPWLVAIATGAPSPTAADEHITKGLGLSNDVARAVRNATRIRQLYPDAWEELIKPDCRPAEAVCRFAGPGPMGVGFQTELHFGTHVEDVSGHPLLLREFQIPRADWTSFDGKGDYPDKPCPIELEGEKWKDFPLSHWWPKAATFERSFGGNQWHVRTDDKASGGNLRVGIKNAVSTAPSGLPQFWKAIELHQPASHDRPYAHERIRLIVRIDRVIAHFAVGHMEYAYMVPFGRTTNGRERTITVTADFGIGREDDPDRWTAHFINGDNRSALTAPKIYLGVEELGVITSQRINVADATQKLAPILGQLSEAKDTIDLETIIGQSLFDTPPERLISLVA